MLSDIGEIREIITHKYNIHYCHTDFISLFYIKYSSLVARKSIVTYLLDALVSELLVTTFHVPFAPPTAVRQAQVTSPGSGDNFG